MNPDILRDRCSTMQGDMVLPEQTSVFNRILREKGVIKDNINEVRME